MDDNPGQSNKNETMDPSDGLTLLRLFLSLKCRSDREHVLRVVQTYVELLNDEKQGPHKS